MSAEFIAIIAVGLSLAGLMLRTARQSDQRMDRQDGRMDRLESRMERLENRMMAMEQGLAELRERMARLEALLEASLGITPTRQSAEPI